METIAIVSTSSCENKWRGAAPMDLFWNQAGNSAWPPKVRRLSGNSRFHNTAWYNSLHLFILLKWQNYWWNWHKSCFSIFSMHLLTAWQWIVKLYFTSGHGKDQAQVAGELQEERGVDHLRSPGTCGEMSSPVSPNHSVWFPFLHLNFSTELGTYQGRLIQYVLCLDKRNKIPGLIWFV